MVSRIKTIRKNAGVNQSEFAESLGLSRGFIAQVETEKEKFSDRSIRDVCRIYGVNETWLRTGEGEPYAPKTKNEEIAEFLNEIMEAGDDDIRRRWVEVFASLPSEYWEMLDRIAFEYVEKKKKD